jgi:hypothetical protein
LGRLRRNDPIFLIRAHLLAFAGCSQTAEDCRYYNRTDFLRGASSVSHLNPGNPPSGKSANTRRFREEGFAFRRIIDLRLGMTLLHSGVTHFAASNVRDFQNLGFEKVWNPLCGDA